MPRHVHAICHATVFHATCCPVLSGAINKPCHASSLRYAMPYFFFFSFSHLYFPASGQAVVTGVIPSPPRFLASISIAHRVQQSHCSSIFHRVLLTHALALSASQFAPKQKSPRIYTSMHSGGFELTKLTYTRLEDTLICHRRDRPKHIFDPHLTGCTTHRIYMIN